jgi:hypothetical protein
MSGGPRFNRRWFRFSLWTLLLVVLCFAGFFGGLRIGYDRGYASGQGQRERETPIARVYDVTDLLLAPPSGRQSFSDLIELVTGTVRPDSWDDTGGVGTIAPFEAGDSSEVETRRFSLVISQTPNIHAQVEKLLRNLRENKAAKIEKP